VSEETIRKYEEYLSYLIRREMYDDVNEDYKKEEKDSGGTKLSCEDVKRIYGTVYWVVGDNLIKSIKMVEDRLKYPPIYFRSGECSEMLSEMGINEPGVYVVKDGKLVRKIRRFDYWFRKLLSK